MTMTKTDLWKAIVEVKIRELNTAIELGRIEAQLGTELMLTRTEIPHPVSTIVSVATFHDAERRWGDESPGAITKEG